MSEGIICLVSYILFNCVRNRLISDIFSVIDFRHPGKSPHIPLSIAQGLEYECKPHQRFETVRDREVKEVHLALVNSLITQLVEQSADFSDQINTLMARKQEMAISLSYFYPSLTL